MNARIGSMGLVALSITTCVATAAWYRAHLELDEMEQRLVSHELEPIATILKENEGQINDLKNPPFSEEDSGILESYLVKLRRDGIAKTSEMKQRLDTLAENNTAIATLLTAYLPNAKTLAFATEGNRFKTYAAAWRDRWNSSTELFMAGGNYPNASPPFPRDFAAAVQAEIAAAK